MMMKLYADGLSDSIK